MELRIHRFLTSSKVDGPGERAVIFVQGCPIRCPGCAVPWTWEAGAGTPVGADELVSRILNGPPVEGVTFLGGEPFAQAAPLTLIGRAVKEAGLSVITFTGYTIEEILKSRRPDWSGLLDVTDLLIDGPFVRELSDTGRPWVGSSNQKYHFMTPRYKHIEKNINDIPNRLEVRILPNGMVSINGLIATDDLKKYISNLVD
jgi:anaerobic ribonucleoside-triphosphate reductase activating protein